MNMPRLIEGPTVIKAAGNKPKQIHEYFGQVNSGNSDLSIAHMQSPAGWVEPGQRPEFTKYTLVLKGCLHVETESGTMQVQAGQSIVTSPGEWVRYSSPDEDTDYIAVCTPAFSPDTVHRDEE